jgi:phage I-like protein
VAELAYYAIKGQDVDNLVKSEREALLAKIRAGESIQGIEGTVSTTPAPEGKPTLSAEELKVAEMMNVTPEEYIKHRRK